MDKNKDSLGLTRVMFEPTIEFGDLLKEVDPPTLSGRHMHFLFSAASWNISLDARKKANNDVGSRLNLAKQNLADADPIVIRRNKEPSVDKGSKSYRSRLLFEIDDKSGLLKNLEDALQELEDDERTQPPHDLRGQIFVDISTSALQRNRERLVDKLELASSINRHPAGNRKPRSARLPIYGVTSPIVVVDNLRGVPGVQ